jgi:hypothetical protein
MKPVKVLLIHRDNDNYRHLCGWWSYAVPEFEWNAIKVKPTNFSIDLKQAPPHDLVVLDDWVFGKVKNLEAPLAYCTVDSARSPGQLERNRHQAEIASLILVDSDNLESFSGLGKPVKRFAYAVDEMLYFPREKVYDVAFLCWPTDERRVVQKACGEICHKHGWRYLTGTYDWGDYAQLLSSAKVVVHMPHVKAARSWRVFDVMASRGALLTMELPYTSGDGLIRGTHYREYNNTETLERELIALLDYGAWKVVSEAGYDHVMKHHTWKIRAAQLRQTIYEVLGW